MPARNVARRALSMLALATLVACGHAPIAPSPMASDAPASAQPARQFEFTDTDIATLQQRMQAGTLTSRALTQAYLDRIAAIDATGPSLHAVIQTNPQAL